MCEVRVVMNRKEPGMGRLWLVIVGKGFTLRTYNLVLHAIAGTNIARLKVYEFPLFYNQNLGRITRITVFVKRELSQNGVKVANVR